MQLNFNNYQTQPSFGMAELTKRGNRILKSIGVKETIDFRDDKYYTQENIVGDYLASQLNSKRGASRSEFEEKLDEMFDAGTTQSAYDNFTFGKKQLFNKSAKKIISDFLNKNSTDDEFKSKQKFLSDKIREYFRLNFKNKKIDPLIMIDFYKMLHKYDGADDEYYIQRTGFLGNTEYVHYTPTDRIKLATATLTQKKYE